MPLATLLRPLLTRHAPPSVRAAGVLLLLASSASAEPGHGVAPGQEDLVAEMLGRGESLADCRLVDVDMQPAAIAGSYRCEGLADPVVVVLQHPSDQRGASFTTLHFAASTRGAVPPGLLATLHARITEHEAQWRWLDTDAARASRPTDAQAGDRQGWFWLPPAAAAAAMLLVVAAGLARARNSSGRRNITSPSAPPPDAS